MAPVNKHFFRSLSRDAWNRLRYGSGAPRYGERIYVRADTCKAYLPSQALQQSLGMRLRRASGRVVGSWPDAEILSLLEHPKINYCLRHWQLGETWEQTGALAYMQERIDSSPEGRFDGCSSLEDVRNRLRRLDSIYSELASGRPFKSAEEIDAGAFREVSGVMVHVDPEGQPVFGGGGAHRLAMAYALGLRIPAQLGVVCRSGIPFLPTLRQPNERSSVLGQ